MSLTNSQYDALIRQYDAKQLRSQRIHDERLKEVYEQCPQLQQIDQSISHLAVSRARRMLEGDAQALSSLRQELADLRKDRTALITSLQLPADYLEIPYECKDCKDTGFIGNKRCHCFNQAAIDLIYSQSNTRRILEKENFQNFSFSYYSKKDISPTTGRSSYDSAIEAVTRAREFIKTFDSEFQNLYLYGNTGVGKTFLTNCIAKELLDTSHSVVYLTAYELFDIFSKTVFQKDKDAIRTNQNIFDCDLLIIDDLGTEVVNNFTSSQFFLCINERILRERSTIISTNLGVTQLKELYSERTFSRITSKYGMIRLEGEDIRLQKKLLKNKK